MNSVIVRIGKSKKTVTVKNSSKILIDKKEYSYELIHLQNSTYILNINDHFLKVNCLDKNGDNYILSIDGKKYLTSSKSPLKDKAEELVGKENLDNTTKLLKAPMPGLVLEVNVQVGAKVQKGTILLILEAMKMENSIKSSFSGVIKKIYVKKNSTVEKNANLFLIE